MYSQIMGVFVLLKVVDMYIQDSHVYHTILDIDIVFVTYIIYLTK